MQQVLCYFPKKVLILYSYHGTGCQTFSENSGNGGGGQQSGFVLIDEVESLAAARKAALSGSEPSDSIRVVNALLTQMDKLKSSPNVIIMTTSNITAAIDIAFVDRADIKAYVGPPTLQARYEILRSCFQELLRTRIVYGCQLILPNYTTLKGILASATTEDSQFHLNIYRHLLEAAEACEVKGDLLSLLIALVTCRLDHIISTRSCRPVRCTRPVSSCFSQGEHIMVHCIMIMWNDADPCVAHWLYINFCSGLIYYVFLSY